MRHATMFAAFFMVWVGAEGASGQDGGGTAALEARLLLDHGTEAVVRRGERVRIRYRTSRNAYTAVFRVDTDGRISLLHPIRPGLDGWVAGGRDHLLVLPGSPYWRVSDDPGSGYLFLVASPEPLDFGAFGFHPDFGWDLSAVGTVVYTDPYLAMDDFVAALIPDWQEVGYALDFATYHVDQPRSYPRFLCYDCHTYRSYAEWNPYAEVCSSYRIVVYDDPYYHPAYRYAGARVVFPTPVPDRPRYAVAVRGGGEGWTPIVRVRTAPATTFKETPSAAPRPAASGLRAPAATRRSPDAVRRSPAAVRRASPSAPAAPDSGPTCAGGIRGSRHPSRGRELGAAVTRGPIGGPFRRLRRPGPPPPLGGGPGAAASRPRASRRLQDEPSRVERGAGAG